MISRRERIAASGTGAGPIGLRRRGGLPQKPAMHRSSLRAPRASVTVSGSASGDSMRPQEAARSSCDQTG